jgi:hypothetical protein
VVSQVRWSDVSDEFEVDGSLKDVYVLDATEADWQKVVDLVRSRGWGYEYSEDGRPLPVPGSVAQIFKNRLLRAVRLAFWPVDGLRVHAHFFDAEQVELDLDPSQVQGQAALDHVCALLRAIGRTLTREVVLTWENSPEAVLLAYRPDGDRVEAGVR